MKRTLKQLAALLILAVTLGAFVYYFAHHPAALHQLAHIPLLTLMILFILYLGVTGTTALILLATVRLCNTRIPARDSVLLTMWSSIINFFGPLQSGPAFRAVYLRKVHNVSLKSYGIATMLYYGFYAVISGLFLLSGLVAWYYLVLLLGLGAIGAAALLRSPLRLARKIRALPLRHAYMLAIATFLQLAVVATIYTIELKSINPSVSIPNDIVYTGAANFALFVSITPGAIGFREAFLVFSQKLHHIDQATIFAANLVDRALYVSLLGVLFLVAISIHAQGRLTRQIAKDSHS